jgi:hypothetical protein
MNMFGVPKYTVNSSLNRAQLEVDQSYDRELLRAGTSLDMGQLG